MNLEQYASGGREAYASLAKLVSEVLASSIDQHGRLRLQQVQSRAKDPMSLRVKLEKTGATESQHVENEVKDLAGCRLVFYTNTDVAIFLSSGILQEQFKVDWPKTKFHHPVPQASEDTGWFISNNFVVQLKDELATQWGCERFKDLLCEVQVQTILNHAWSEMEHDILYKRPSLDGFGSRLMSSIEERLQAIMRNYLVPAGYEFQKVVNDFERLSSGKELFDEGPLTAISNCQDNNELYERLTSFSEHVLPNYDNLETVQGAIRKTILDSMESALSRKVKPIDTPFGQFDGYTADSVLELASDILDRLRYLGEEAVIGTFDAICVLYEGARSDNQRKRLLSSARDIAKHSLEVWRQTGWPVVEDILVTRIQSLDLSQIGASKAIVLEVLGQILSPEVKGTSSTYNTVTIQTGAVDPSDLLVKVRSAAIDTLLSIFRAATSDNEKRMVLQELSEASRTPTMGDYPNSLLIIALNDTTRIVQFLTDVSREQSYIFLEEFEHDCLWHYRRSNPLPPSMESDSEVVSARDRLTTAILAFRDQINTDQRFVIFKTLVGFQSVFLPAWEDSNFNFDISGFDDYRKAEIAKLVDQVNDGNAEEWLQIILNCASTPSDDLATFPSFGSFLEQLGANKPEIVMEYLARLDSALANFLPQMLYGLELSQFKDAAIEQARKWVGEGKHLAQIILYCQHSKALDPGLLEQGVQRAIYADDASAVLYALQASVARFKVAPDNMTNLVFLPALRYLTERGRYEWVNAIWPRSESEGLLQSLTPEQQDEVLLSMVTNPDVNHNAEQILKAIAVQSPDKVIDFFGSRLDYERKSESWLRYEEIPHQFYYLEEPLRQTPEFLVRKVRQWFGANKEFFTYRGGRMISAVFPNPDAKLITPLHEMAMAGNLEDKEFVIDILKNYHGEVAIHGLFKDLVEALPEGSDLLGEISSALDSAGVVSGEFGQVAAYLRKKEELKPWLDDHREKVQNFAKNHILGLDRLIADEQRRAEQALELRKRDYG